jgi:hypothetical protein
MCAAIAIATGRGAIVGATADITVTVVGTAGITPTTVQVSTSTSVLVTGTVATADTMAVIEDITAAKLE